MVLWLLPVWVGLALGQQTADTVLRNEKIYTLDASSSQAQALAISKGRIVFTGSDDSVQPFIGTNTTVIDLNGRMAMPGLIDAHMHTGSAGTDLIKCNLNYETLSIEQLLEHIQKCINADPGKKVEGQWLEVVNLDLSGMTSKSGVRTKADLDKLNTKRPVVITTTDHHTWFANSAALKASGINASTPDPNGGRIDRLPGSQEPSGMLQDNASRLLAGPLSLTDDELTTGLEAALRVLREAGITTFQEAVARPSQYTLFRRIDVPQTIAQVDGLVKDTLNVTSTFNDNSTLGPNPVLKWQAVKLFMDGVIQYPANTGAVLEPYLKQVGNTSEWAVPANASAVQSYAKLEPLATLLGELVKNGIDAQIHADGDAAVRRVLDAVEAFRSQSPNVTDYKITMTHAELSHPDDWKRRGELGVDAILSFHLRPQRLPYLEAFVDIAEGGRPVIYGSDCPIDSLDEFLALKAAVSRKGDPQNPRSPGSHGPPWDTATFPGRTMTREAALRAITIEAAGFLRADAHVGSLEVGKLADVIVLERNYFEVPEEEIARQKVLLIMLGGEVLYVANGTSFGQGVTPKLPNAKSTAADVKNVGGFSGRSISEQAKRHRATLGRRHACHH